MNKIELSKYCKKYIKPFLASKEFVWVDFEITTYRFVKEKLQNKFLGSGNFFSRSDGLELDLPSYGIYLNNFNNLFY
jgi:hypothetical protein